MSDIDKIYYCNHCKNFLGELEELLFVEEGTSKGFCSEDCIEKFYQHLVDHFENLDKEYRKELGLSEESCLKFVGKPKLMEMVLSSPNEIWHTSNEIQEEYFSFIRKVTQKGEDPFYLIIICLIYDNKPSFILSATATRDNALIDKYRGEKKLDNNMVSTGEELGDVEEGFQTVEIEEELLEAIELKKSQLLANLLEERSPSDIPFERFNMYDEFIEDTLQQPDEVYKDTDEEGDIILTYIKAHELNGISFYYFCVCMKYEKALKEGIETLLPIITFPSLDGEIYDIYKRGVKVTGPLKN